MMYARVKGDSNWYRVLNIIDPGVQGQNIYVLYGRGRVQAEDLDDLDFE